MLSCRTRTRDFVSGRIEPPILGFVLLPHADRAEPHFRVLVCWFTTNLVGPRDSGRNFCSALVSPWRAIVRVRQYTLCSDKTSTFHQQVLFVIEYIIINIKYASLDIAISGGSIIHTACPPTLATSTAAAPPMWRPTRSGFPAFGSSS